MNTFQANDTLLSSPLSSTGPMALKKGTSVTFIPLLMHRRKDVWGDDAEDFIPERWLKTSDERIGTDRFVAFSAGPRIWYVWLYNGGSSIEARESHRVFSSLGQAFAYQETSYFIIRLLQHYDNFAFDLDAQPQRSVPPSSWKLGEGRQSVEQCWPRSSLNLYVQVSARY